MSLPSSRFHLSVDDCRYSLRFTPVTKAHYDYKDVVYDGTNVYFLISYQNSGDAFPRPPNGGIAANVANAFVDKGPVFRQPSVHEAGPIWLALASACYLRNTSNDMMEAVLAFDDAGPVSPGNVRIQKTRIDLQPEFPNLPIKAVFFDNGKLPNGWTYPVPYNLGFTSAIYEVQGFKSFSGFQFPAESTLKVYYHKQGGRTNTDLRLAVQYMITVSDVTLSTDVSVSQPIIPGPSTLIDNRLHAAAGSVPFRRITSWPSEQDLTNSTEYKHALTLPRGLPPYTSTGRRFIVLLIAFWIIAAFPLLFVIRKTFRPKTLTQTAK